MKTPEQLAEEFAELFAGERRKTIAKKSWWTGYQAAKQWISVKDSEPSDETWVLGTNGRDIECVFKHFTDCYSMTTITHWMPLPKPPEEK